MTRDLDYGFEDLADGVTVAPGNSPFDVVQGSCVASTTTPILGSVSCVVTASGTATFMSKQYTARDLSHAEMYFRTPAAGPASPVYLMNAQAVGVIMAQARLNTDLSVAVRNRTTLVGGTPATTLAASTDHRAEWEVDSAGTRQRLQVFLLHGTSPVVDTGYVAYTTGTHDRMLYGVAAAGTMTYRVDRVALDDTSAIGPAVTAAAPPRLWVPSPVATHQAATI